VIKLSSGEWFGLQRIGPSLPERLGWHTPILITKVVPFKSGKDRLHLEWVEAIHPLAPSKLSLEVYVICRQFDFMVIQWRDEFGSEISAVVSQISDEWFRINCREVSECIGWERISVLTEESLIVGATLQSFGSEIDTPKIDMPRRIWIDIVLSPIQSYMLHWGAIPFSMDDKWFIFKWHDHICVRRSWSGEDIFLAKLIQDEQCFKIEECHVQNAWFEAMEKTEMRARNTFINLLSAATRKAIEY